MNAGDVAAMDTDVQQALASQQAPPAPMPQGQEDLATTLQRLFAPMQQQLAQLAPMSQRLEKVAEGLNNVTNKVAYLEADREDSDFDSFDGEDAELDLLQEDETMTNGGEFGSAGQVSPKGRGRRTNAGNVANILNKTIRKSRAQNMRHTQAELTEKQHTQALYSDVADEGR